MLNFSSISLAYHAVPQKNYCLSKPIKKFLKWINASKSFFKNLSDLSQFSTVEIFLLKKLKCEREKKKGRGEYEDQQNK